MSKIQELAHCYGHDCPLDLMGEYILDSLAPAICMNPGCDYTTEMEPDQRAGWCECCETNSVKSLNILLGII